MAGLWQRTGNVTVTNGSKTITGFGTKWKTGTLPIQKGHTFYGPDNAAYEVDTVVSDESILLVDTYRGGTLANQAYRIDITRTSTISQFAADLASLVAKYRSWFDGMMTWLTGSGDVAILNPDTGANVTIPSWKKVASEGEGQAARAKTEADKAAASAALAGDIVVASVLPLPDVWAPLSDSLRLITGYGRDVLVGSDVVARMVNFSRNSTATYIGKDGQLKTAAANEPRFEKEGLLIEGQSTNLVPSSDNFSSYNSKPTVTTPESDGFTVFDLNQVAFTGSASSLTVGAIYTISALVDVSGPCVMRIGFGGQNRDVTISAAMRGVISLSANCASNDGALGRIGPISRNAGVTIRVRYLQLEALPFASSYIPTAGAAVTRAPDMCSMVKPGNFPPDGVVSWAVTVDALKCSRSGGVFSVVSMDALSPSRYTWFNTVSSSTNLPAHGSLRIGTQEITSMGDLKFMPGVLAMSSSKSEVTTRSGGVLTKRSIVNDYTPDSTNPIFIGSRLGGSDGMMFGHIHNLRIWHRALTENQIKAIA